MAIFTGTVRSTSLAMDTGMTVILPWDRPAEPQADPCPVLYLLHGLGDNHAAWARYTGIERYARLKGVAVVMPEVQRSFYRDMAHGLAYFTYIVEELPALCGKMFHLSRRREDSYVAGLSMGGYGALKCGLAYPERYRGCASFSGAVDIVRVLEEHHSEEYLRELQAVLGMDLIIGEGDNLLLLANKVAKLPQTERPDIFLTCGSDDFLREINLGFQQYLRSIPMEFAYQEWPGEHDWDFWNESLRRVLERWFPA